MQLGFPWREAWGTTMWRHALLWQHDSMPHSPLTLPVPLSIQLSLCVPSFHLALRTHLTSGYL